MEAREFVSSLEFDESDGNYGWIDSAEYCIDKISEKGWCWLLSLWRNIRKDRWGQPSHERAELIDGVDYFFGDVCKRIIPVKGSNLEKKSGTATGYFRWQIISFECKQENKVNIERVWDAISGLDESFSDAETSIKMRLDSLGKGYFNDLSIFSWNVHPLVTANRRGEVESILEELERILS